MSLSPSRNYWNDARRSQFRAFFDRPLHAIELEDRKNERDLNSNRTGNLGAKFEFNSLGCDVRDASQANYVAAGDIEFLADSGAKYTR
jgi:hypothetical protein